MARWIILVDQYGNETKLAVPSGLTTPVVGWDGVDKPEWIEAPAGGGGAHAASHADGGADEVAIDGLPTAETDDALVLAPDGAGGVEFRAEAGGGYTPFSDKSETATVQVIGGTTQTDIHSRTLVGLAAGTYLINASAWVQVANAGRMQLMAGGTVLSDTDSRSTIGQRVLFGAYIHTVTGDLIVKLTHQSESVDVTYGLAGDNRFGRKLLVVRVG